MKLLAHQQFRSWAENLEGPKRVERVVAPGDEAVVDAHGAVHLRVAGEVGRLQRRVGEERRRRGGGLVRLQELLELQEGP